MSFAELGTVLVVDDDALVRDATAQSLELAALRVEAFAGARLALARIDAGFNGVIVSDIRMPDIDGLQFFKAVQAIDPAIPVVLMTGHGDVPMAVAALRDGVDDFLTKPFAAGHLIASVRRGLERRRLELDNRALRAMVEAAADGGSALVGETPAIVALREAIAQMAGADVHVLIEGETGTGKELVALMLHRRGKRRTHRFVNVNCAALVDGGAAARLFGAADAREAGAVELADRGTLFLDEIDRLDPAAQPRLLRAIEDGEVVRRPGDPPSIVDLRVIAALRGDPAAAIAEGRLREELVFALDVVRLRLPPLRERRADIPLLFAHFVDEATTQLRRPARRLTDRDRRHLLEHDWPGNVRELRSFAFATVVGVDDPQVSADEDAQLTLPQRVDRFEAAAIRATLEEARGSAAEAIAALGLPRKTFYDKLQRHGISIADFRR